MSSQLGPIFANIFLCVQDVLWLEKREDEFRPVIYKRSVDDTFLLFLKYQSNWKIQILP